MAAAALLAIAIGKKGILLSLAESKTRNTSIDEIQQQHQHQQYEIARKTRQKVGPVPLEVIESMDPKLINFVIAGFPKCGTTYLQNKIFYESEKVFIPHHETTFLANDKYEEFKNEFANVTQLQKNSRNPLVVGYKAPFELGKQRSLRNLQAFFPDIRMIITMRHPVLEFQSLYNMNLRKLPEIPPLYEHVGNCREQCLFSSSEGTETTVARKKASQKCLKDVAFCTGGASFHQFLSRLGLTPMNTTEELDLLDYHHMSIHPFPEWKKQSDGNSDQRIRNSDQQSYLRSPSQNTELNHREGASKSEKGNKGRLFLIENGQMDNFANQSIADDLNSDLEKFLGLEPGDLPRAPPGDGDKRRKIPYYWPPGREEHKLRICLERHRPLREVLMQTSRKASKWILEYLLHPSNLDVVVASNMDTFKRMIEGWNTDPCSNEDEGSQ